MTKRDFGDWQAGAEEARTQAAFLRRAAIQISLNADRDRLLADAAALEAGAGRIEVEHQASGRSPMTALEIADARIAVEGLVVRSEQTRRHCSERFAKSLETIRRSREILAISAPRYP